MSSLESQPPSRDSMVPLNSKERLQLLESAVLQSGESILITDALLDLPGPRVVFVNAAFTAMTGYAPQEILGRTPRILQGPKTDRTVLARLKGNLLQGITCQAEVVNYRKDGTEFVIEWRIAAIRDDSARVTHFVALQRDVTEVRRNQNAANRLAAIVEFSEDAIIGKGLDGIINSWNRGAEKIFGYSAGEMIGTSIMRLIPKDRHSEEDSILERIRSGQSIQHFETLRLTKAGALVAVSVTASPIRNAAGSIVGVSKCARDITARTTAEAERKAIDVRQRALFEYAPDGILIADPSSIYIDANASICRMLGYSRSELIGLHASDIVAPVEARHVTTPNADLQDGAEYHREWQFRRKDGSVFQAEVMATAMPDGNLMGMIRDVTDRRAAEAKIAEQAAFMEKARDAIIVRDLEGNVLYWNNGAERIYGWSSREMIGRNMQRLFPDPAGFAELNSQTLEAGEWHGELVHETRDGREIAVEARWTLIRDNEGRPKSILAMNSDITEKKKIEAQFMRAQRMESIGTLAGGVAHDLNNILTPILMSIELLKGLFSGPEAEDLLRTIELSAKRGADIVRQVLTFARGVEGQRILVRPRQILADLASIMRDTFPRDIRLSFETAKDAWNILGDPTQIHQILLNLCVNARDAMPRGGRLSVVVANATLDESYAAMKPGAKPGHYLKISVVDSATGIPPAIIDKIFEPFFTTKEINKGTGLGLSTVTAIAKSHGGFVDVYSEMGKGTTFSVYLPAGTLPDGGGPFEEPEIELRRGKNELILVVDDEPTILRITTQTLCAFGYRTVTALDGAEAVAVFLQRKEEISLVLTDMMMPIMDGAALIHVLNKLDPRMKIVAASGLSVNEEAARAAMPKIKHFLAKPYTARTLLQTIGEALE